MNRPHGQILALLFTALSLACAPALASKPEHKGKPEKAQHSQSSSGASSSDTLSISLGISFDGARQLAVESGATGYSSLPPGIRKNLARGKPLPPGIAKKAVPATMLSRLPQHPGYEWLVVGNDLVEVAISTSLIANVLSGVFD